MMETLYVCCGVSQPSQPFDRVAPGHGTDEYRGRRHIRLVYPMQDEAMRRLNFIGNHFSCTARVRTYQRAFSKVVAENFRIFVVAALVQTK